MDIKEIIKSNLPDGVEIGEKTLNLIAKELKSAQGDEFIPKTQYAKKTERIDELEGQISDLQGKSTDADTYKQKFEDLKTKYDTDIAAEQTKLNEFKSAAETQKTIDEKKSLLRSQLSADGANPKLVDLLEMKFDIEKIELHGDGDNKKIKDWDTISKPVKEQYADIFGTTTIQGAIVAAPPVGDGTKPDYVTQLKTARESGKTQDAVRIKTEAAKDGVYLI